MRHRPFTLACGFMLMLGMAGSGVSSEYRGRMMFLGRPRLSTIDANLPASGANTLGRTILFNTAVDYRIKGKIWPMLEQVLSFGRVASWTERNKFSSYQAVQDSDRVSESDPVRSARFAPSFPLHP
jgi:hypothetical protein